MEQSLSFIKAEKLSQRRPSKPRSRDWSNNSMKLKRSSEMWMQSWCEWASLEFHRARWPSFPCTPSDTHSTHHSVHIRNLLRSPKSSVLPTFVCLCSLSTWTQRWLNQTSSTKDPHALVNEHIRKLHEYNEIRDVGQGLMGIIAEQRGLRVVYIYREFGIGEGDWAASWPHL